ncbi:MAG: UDP-N-acetylmuramate dehydrogenase [Candidatus Zambryskibacteria bacterium]
MIVDRESAVPNSLAIPAVASFVAKIKSRSEILEINNLAIKEGLPLIVIGEGTNIILRDYVKAVVAILDSAGTEINGNQIKIEGGEKWDDVVKISVENNLSGIEALSAIPGKSGAAPIQNISAYGSEIADCLEDVEAYDKTKKEFVFLNKKECQFGYRNSFFKKYPDRFIVILTTLKLSKEKPKMPKYKGVEEYFEQKNNNSPTLKEIREAIIEIRRNKLPNPKIIPNAGSYFINPIINNKKIYAGELIEKAGLKGAKIGEIEISPKNALILTNPNRAGFKEIKRAEDFIVQKVFQKFGIILEREPRII